MAKLNVALCLSATTGLSNMFLKINQIKQNLYKNRFNKKKTVMFTLRLANERK